MCIRTAVSEWTLSSFALYNRKPRSKRYRIKIQGLNRRKRSGENSGNDMEEKNLKLYMENIAIFKENEKLRKKANLLNQENLILMSEFQKKKLSHQQHSLSSSIDSSIS